MLSFNKPCLLPQKYNDKDHKVKIAIGNGIRADVWQEFLNRFGIISIKELYASTEGNMSFMNYAGKIGAVGRVNFFHKVYVLTQSNMNSYYLFDFIANNVFDFVFL